MQTSCNMKSGEIPELYAIFCALFQSLQTLSSSIVPILPLVRHKKCVKLIIGRPELYISL